MEFYSHEKELLVESDFPRSTPYLNHSDEVVLLVKLELTYGFWGKEKP